MPVTLQDIASRLGVTKSTVSFTLRDHPNAGRFTSATRQRIREVAQEMGYRPNLFATGLSGGQTKLLLLCMNFLRDTWASTIAEAFEHQAAQRGYRVLISTFHDKEDPMAFNRDILGSQGVQAMAAIGSNEDKLTDQAIHDLADKGVRMVLVSREIDDDRVSCVLADNVGGTRLAADHLYEQGIDDIWVIGTQSGSGAQRASAFIGRSRELNRAEPRKLLVEGLDHHQNGYEVVRGALAQESAPRGIFACQDIAAVGAVRALNEKGLVVGRDVAVVGFDGGVLSECCVPPLTTVRQPMREMGRAAADALIDMPEKPGLPAAQVTFPLELVVRGSSVLPANEEERV